jgi:hypothetical protein
VATFRCTARGEPERCAVRMALLQPYLASDGTTRLFALRVERPRRCALVRLCGSDVWYATTDVSAERTNPARLSLRLAPSPSRAGDLTIVVHVEEARRGRARRLIVEDPTSETSAYIPAVYAHVLRPSKTFDALIRFCASELLHGYIRIVPATPRDPHYRSGGVESGCPSAVSLVPPRVANGLIEFLLESSVDALGAFLRGCSWLELVRLRATSRPLRYAVDRLAVRPLVEGVLAELLPTTERRLAVHRLIGRCQAGTSSEVKAYLLSEMARCLVSSLPAR